MLFKFEELTYEIYNNQPLPLGLKLTEDIKKYCNK